MKVELNPGFVLHRRLYRETSLLLDVFSRDYGRISLVARGVRQKGSLKAELLQAYQSLLLSWSGKGELMNLVTVEPDGKSFRLKENRLLAGFYINELVIKLLHMHEAHADLFDIYKKTLELLANDDMDEQVVLRMFEKRLMDSIGYGLLMDHEIDSGQPIEPEIIYYYQSDRGPSTTIPPAGDYIRIKGSALLALSREDFRNADDLDAIRKLMRYALNKHLGDKPLASRELYRSYKHQTGI